MCWMDIRRSDDALGESIRAVKRHEDANGHSWGWAAVVGGEIEIQKGVGEIPDDVDAPVAGAAMCHTRAATKGSVTEENAHPFAVERDGETVAALAHNGTWYGAPDIGDWSDSRAMAMILSSMLGEYPDRAFGAMFHRLGDLTGETIIALHRDGTLYVHSGRFPITRSGTVVSSSGQASEIPKGTVLEIGGVPA